MVVGVVVVVVSDSRVATQSSIEHHQPTAHDGAVLTVLSTAKQEERFREIFQCNLQRGKKLESENPCLN